MKKCLLIVGAVFFGAIVFAADGHCGTYNATGTWNYSTYNDWNNCGDPVYSEAGSVKITQSGNNITIYDNRTGVTYSGSVSNTTYTVSAVYPEEGGTTTENVTFTLTSGVSGYGSANWTWIFGSGSCSGGADFDFNKQSEFSIYGSIENVHRSDDTLWTCVHVKIGTDFTGTLPDQIDRITVYGPSGSLPYDKDDFTYYPERREFLLCVPGSPALGIYTFYVVNGAYSGTADDTQSINRLIPVPDADSFSPPDGAEVKTVSPTLSWQPVIYQGTTLYYQLEIANLSNVSVFTTSRIRNMVSYTVPEDILNTRDAYKWRVLVSDSFNSIQIQNIANSEWASFTVTELKAMPWIPLLLLDK